MQDKEEEKQVSTEFTPLLQDDNEDKMDKMLCENVRTNGLTIFKTNFNLLSFPWKSKNSLNV